MDTVQIGSYTIGILPFYICLIVAAFIAGAAVTWAMYAVEALYLRRRRSEIVPALHPSGLYAREKNGVMRELDGLALERERNYRETCALVEGRAIERGWVTKTVH